MIDDKDAPRKVLERFPWSIESLSAVVKTASMKSRLPAIVSLGFVLCCASAAHAQGGAASPSSESPASSLPAPVAADASESIVTDRPDGERFFNTGLTCLIDDDFQLDARAGVGLNNNVAGPDYFFSFGFARRF